MDSINKNIGPHKWSSDATHLVLVLYNHKQNKNKVCQKLNPPLHIFVAHFSRPIFRNEEYFYMQEYFHVFFLIK
jgi:hypothetical protein